MEKEKLCLRCMRKIGDNNICPYCRNDQSEPQTAPYLPLKCTVGGKYLVGKLVSSDGEGNTYYAFDTERKTPVTLREFFPKGLVSRGEDNYCLVNVGKATDFINTKSEFGRLWGTISGLAGHSSLCPVYDIVEDMGTTYAVTEYLGECKTLREFLLEKTQGCISWSEAEILFMPVLTALEDMHKAGIVHGGISPTTLMLDKNGKLKITGCRIREIRHERGLLEKDITDGYAAVEQYGFSEGLGEYSDVYAVAATLYRALIGSVPMSAAQRLTNDKLMIPGKFAEQLPAYVINALVNALQILPGDRTQTVEMLHAEITASPAAAAASVEISRANAPVYEPPVPMMPVNEIPPAAANFAEPEYQQDKNRIKGSTIAAFVISAVLCLAIIGTVIFLVARNGKENETTTRKSSDVELSESVKADIPDDVDVEKITVPNFYGKVFDELKADGTYKFTLSFRAQYVDSSEPRGTVISQDVAEGTVVSSYNPRTVTVKVSNGLEVPESIIGMDVDEAVNVLNKAGFKKVNTSVGKVADNENDSNKVYDVVIDGKANDWAELPDDRRISANDELLLYYHGEYEEPTEPVTEPVTEPDTQPDENSEPVTEADEDNEPVEDEELSGDAAEDDSEE